MTPKQILRIALLLIPFSFLTAQTSAESAGIAIQGIARDANNTARTDADITLTIELYYVDGAQEFPIILPITANLTTDAFGVFSYVLDAGDENNAEIANHQARLRISEAGSIISDEPLKHAPYAIAANNGVPAGSIMPYLGTTPPSGWVLCDGQALPTDGSADTLINLIGNNAPNLQGMFLRGAGTSPVNGQDGPALMATQEDATKAHSHESGTLVTDERGLHNHTITSGVNVGGGNIRLRTFNRILTNSTSGDLGDTTVSSPDDGGQGTEPNLLGSVVMPERGNHTHIISGSTATTGDTETRPVNYGVNYIIKL